MRKKVTHRLPKQFYGCLCDVLDVYTRIPEEKRPPLLQYQTPYFKDKIYHRQLSVKHGYLTPVGKYIYSMRYDVGGENYKKSQRYYLTGKSAPIIEWWIELGYDWQAMEEGEYPPNEWEEEWEEEDYVPFYKGHKKNFPVKTLRQDTREPGTYKLKFTRWQDQPISGKKR